MSKRLSSLQKKLSQGFEELRYFVVANRHVASDPMQTELPVGEWHKTRRRIAELEAYCDELSSHEVETGQGSVELYWQSKLNAERRRKVLQHIKGKETEFLGRAAVEIGKKLQSMIPPEKLENLMGNRKADGEILKDWAAASDRNLKLLDELGQAEVEFNRSKQDADYWSIAVENATACVNLVQIEESFLLGNLKGWVVYDDKLLGQGVALNHLAKLQRDCLNLEEKLAEIQFDASSVIGMLEVIESDSGVPPRRKETRVLLAKCIEISKKYQGERLRMAEAALTEQRSSIEQEFRQ